MASAPLKNMPENTEPDSAWSNAWKLNRKVRELAHRLRPPPETRSPLPRHRRQCPRHHESAKVRKHERDRATTGVSLGIRDRELASASIAECAEEFASLNSHFEVQSVGVMVSRIETTDGWDRRPRDRRYVVVMLAVPILLHSRDSCYS
jgi:hypothetical protein